jgi:hypothetical protein
VQFSKKTDKAIRDAIKLAQEEGIVIVGFAVPKSLDNEEDFSWAMFKSDVTIADAESLLCSIAEVIRDNEENVDKGLVN